MNNILVNILFENFISMQTRLDFTKFYNFEINVPRHILLIIIL